MTFVFVTLIRKIRKFHKNRSSKNHGIRPNYIFHTERISPQEMIQQQIEMRPDQMAYVGFDGCEPILSQHVIVSGYTKMID